MADKLGKGAATLVKDLGDGKKVSITQTAAGARANMHIGGLTIPVDPADYGVSSLGSSEPGGGARRVTTHNTDGTSTDYTRQADGTLGTVVHDGPASHPKK